MAEYKYQNATPVDEPISTMPAPVKAKIVIKPVPKPMPKPIVYPDSTPVDEPTVNKAKGGKVSSASSRADGIAQRGKTRGTYV